MYVCTRLPRKNNGFLTKNKPVGSPYEKQRCAAKTTDLTKKVCPEIIQTFLQCISVKNYTAAFLSIMEKEKEKKKKKKRKKEKKKKEKKKKKQPDRTDGRTESDHLLLIH
jgi:hypothetical protein